MRNLLVEPSSILYKMPHIKSRNFPGMRTYETLHISRIKSLLNKVITFNFLANFVQFQQWTYCIGPNNLRRLITTCIHV